MYLPKYAGVDPETGEALYWAKDENGQEYKTVDMQLANQNKQATDDLLPTVYGGFGTSISAFGFDASIQCSYQLGGTIYDSGYAAMMHGGTNSYAGRNWHTDIRNSWTPENRNTDIPRVNSLIDKLRLFVNQQYYSWLHIAKELYSEVPGKQVAFVLCC